MGPVKWKIKGPVGGCITGHASHHFVRGYLFEKLRSWVPDGAVCMTHWRVDTLCYLATSASTMDHKLKCKELKIHKMADQNTFYYNEHASGVDR